MAFEYWNSLSNEEKFQIAAQAQEAQDKMGHRTCYWCGSPLGYKGHDYTSGIRNHREICKGFCKQRRFFDNPE